MRLRNIPEASERLKADKHYVIQDIYILKEDVSKKLFNNDNPIYIEIGMGKGGFLFENAKRNPNINYIGIEVYKTVLYLALNKMNTHEEKLNNIKIVEYDAKKIEELFKPKSIDKIFLTFSDPWPKAKHHKRRLNYREFLKQYYKILKDGGILEIKTDQQLLFNFGLNEISEIKLFNILDKTNNLHAYKDDVIKTEYETKFSNMNHPIYWIKIEKIKDYKDSKLLLV